MNRLMNVPKTALPRASKGSLRNRFSRAALAFLGIATLLSITTLPAKASGCGEMGGLKNPIKLPMLDEATAPPTDSLSIVGLWHVTYTIGDTTNLFGISLKQWHSDGTEFENIDHSPVIGNVCFGVWKWVRPGVVRLHHTGWLFDDNGNPTGSFIILETDTMAANDVVYTGVFDFKVYDQNGDYVSGSEVTGRVAAKRITVD